MEGVGGGGGGEGGYVFKTYLPSAYVSRCHGHFHITYRIPRSNGRRQTTKKLGGKGVECGGHTFTSGKRHLYFRLKKFEKS